MQFNQVVRSNSSLTVGRYFRLMALAMTEIMLTSPLAIFTIVLNATSTEIGPWRSWDDTHFAYSRIEQIPALLWRSHHLLVVSMELTRWLAPATAVTFFLFFGFAEEARKQYCSLFLRIKRVLLSFSSTKRCVLYSLMEFKFLILVYRARPVSPLPVFIIRKQGDRWSSRVGETKTHQDADVHLSTMATETDRSYNPSSPLSVTTISPSMLSDDTHVTFVTDEIDKFRRFSV